VIFADRCDSVAGAPRSTRFHGGCASISIVSLDTENITGQVEGSNLTAAVGEKLKRTDRTRNDLIDRFRRLGFSENFSPSALVKVGPKAFLARRH
jgi:hypothetical protein